MQNRKLTEALYELSIVCAAAEDDEMEVPSPLAVSNAYHLINEMFQVSPRRYAVYPLPEGCIGIDARAADKKGIVLVSCGSDGSVVCHLSIEGDSRWHRYQDVSYLPDDFIRTALLSLPVGKA